MKIICAGCGKQIGEKSSRIFGDHEVSHGLCKSCEYHFIAQAGMPLTEYLEGIAAPVVTVTPEGIIGTANTHAHQLLGKSIEQIRGYPGGDVFECEYAMLPEGCGKTIHCSGCTIRKTVMDTMHTGNPHQRKPAYLNQNLDGASHQIRLLISTEKKGGIVFLIVEEIGPASPYSDTNHDA